MCTLTAVHDLGAHSQKSCVCVCVCVCVCACVCVCVCVCVSVHTHTLYIYIKQKCIQCDEFKNLLEEKGI